MIIIRNSIIPFKGYTAVNLFGILFVRKNAVLLDSDIRHEQIHTAQMKEMLYIFFYIWYLIEWIVRIFKNGYSNAYKNISFEQEAYNCQHIEDYLSSRSHYGWFDYYK